MHLDIEKVINKLSNKRPVFFSEADFQHELNNILREEYPEASIRLEYKRYVEPIVHLDVLVVIDYDKWFPIELKYRTKDFIGTVNGEEYNLKNQGAKDIGSYLYLKDIQRIEEIKEKEARFVEGYTIFITNDLAYTKAPTKANANYNEFSLENGTVKTGVLNWSKETGECTKKGYEDSIILKSEYPIEWKEYSKLSDIENGTFMYLCNTIKRY